MTPTVLSTFDITVSALLVLLAAGLSIVMSLQVHKSLLIAAGRLIVQLLLVGSVLRYVFQTQSGLLTLGVLAVMMSAAAYEVGSRLSQRLAGWWRYGLGGLCMSFATILACIIGLTTTLRPEPWFAARSAIPLCGLVLGNVMNGVSLALNSLLGSVVRERAAIEARLALGDTRNVAMRGLIRQAVRTALIPTINSMAAAGIITMPGIMTGQLLAGMDPVNAAKYQIVLMFLIVTANFIGTSAAAIFAARRVTDQRERLRLDRIKVA